MAKIIIPVITFFMTAGFSTMFAMLVKKTTPIFATVRK